MNGALTYDSLDLVLVEGGLDGPLGGRARAAPALPRHRARRQLRRAEENRCQSSRQLPVVAPLDRSQLLLAHGYALAKVHLPAHVLYVKI